MKLTGYEVDWKDDFDPKEIGRLLNEVGGQRCLYDWDVSGWVDSKLLFLSSDPLSESELMVLWKTGDLTVTDKVWEGTYEEILIQLAKQVNTDYLKDLKWAKNAGL